MVTIRLLPFNLSALLFCLLVRVYEYYGRKSQMIVDFINTDKSVIHP